MKLYQLANYGIGGCTDDIVERLQVQSHEYWKESDIKYLDCIELNNLNDLSERFLLSKRAMLLDNGESVIVPKGEIAMSLYLGMLFKLYTEYKKEYKESLKIRFENKLYILRIEIAKRLFSKKFSEKYQFKFNGISGVALSHARHVDEVLVPEWYNDRVSIGDLVMITRDPIQNIVVTCKVAGFTPNEIRVNPKLIVMLGGDFDGDKIQVIPLINIYKDNKKFFNTTFFEFEQEMLNLMPSNFKFKELI